jgi:hypothetical protein
VKRKELLERPGSGLHLQADPCAFVVNEKWVERVRILPIVGPNLVRVQVCHEDQDRSQWWGEDSRHVTAGDAKKQRNMHCA